MLYPLLIVTLSCNYIWSAPLSIGGLHVHLPWEKSKPEAPPAPPSPDLAVVPSCIFPNTEDNTFYQLPAPSILTKPTHTYICYTGMEQDPQGRSWPVAMCQVDQVAYTPCRGIPPGNYVTASGSAVCVPPKAVGDGIHGTSGWIPGDCPPAS